MLPYCCILCKSDLESADQIFLHLTLRLWLKLVWEGKNAKLCGAHTMVWKGKKARVMWGTMILTLFWVVWMKRNRRIFEDFVGAGSTALWIAFVVCQPFGLLFSQSSKESLFP